MLGKTLTIDTPDGNRLSLADWGGKGAPLLLLHGMGAHTHWWDKTAPLLAEHYRVVALDFRGHGDSGWLRPPRYQMTDYTEDIEAARKHLGWEKFHIAAHSMGARAAIHYSVANPERIDKLAVLDFLIQGDPASYARFERRRRIRQPKYSDPEVMAERFHLQPDGTLLSKDELKEFARHGIRKGDNGFWSWKFDWQAFDMVYSPYWDELARLTTETFVIRGEMSTVLPRDSFDKTLKTVKNSRGAEISEAHHHVILDKPEESARLLLGFFGA